MNLPNIIGLTGAAGSGKDTLAKHLVEKHGYTRLAFADPIKFALNQLYGWTMAMWENREWKENPCVYVRGNPKVCLSPRQLAQWYGTEGGREIFGDNCWVKVLEQHIWSAWEPNFKDDAPLKKFVVSDVRFDNEASALRALHGVILKIERQIPTISTHVSEKGIHPHQIRHHIFNLGTIQDLHNAFDVMFSA